jgi:hypothetical protein
MIKPFKRVDFLEFSAALLNDLVQTPFDDTNVPANFTVSLTSGPMDRVVVKFHGRYIEYLVPSDFPNPERRNTFTNRWLCTRPLFAAVKQLYPSLRGECQLWLGDRPSGPGLAFCGNAVSHVCIPDMSYLTNGYAGRRRAIAAAMKPWASRLPKIFWRGATTGYPRDPWKAIPRIKLCLISREIARADTFDTGISRIVQVSDRKIEQEIIKSGIFRGHCPRLSFMDYKFTIDIDGNSCSWSGLFTKLLMQNTIIKVDSPLGFRQWYYNKLVPWRNFVPLSSSMTELNEVAEWLLEHDDEAEQIAIRGRELAESLTFDQMLLDVAPIIRDHVEATKMIKIPETV